MRTLTETLLVRQGERYLIAKEALPANVKIGIGNGEVTIQVTVRPGKPNRLNLQRDLQWAVNRISRPVRRAAMEALVELFTQASVSSKLEVEDADEESTVEPKKRRQKVAS